ncbi:uncharacterized protein LOC108049713 [Drosophila rhopaloa]|uniref:Uncharacterized protein LOC108049713 n=1 Tax=Drosophila rhopaloa TaxID=1041015 RepID=A0A6P4F889_DRORH|nr:uncharacterized protein LOC108049713 [Drosophila rhopaloa]
MYSSESINVLCGVGVPRPNFQRLITYVEPGGWRGWLEEHREMQVWRRRKRSSVSASSISETRLHCPEAFLRVTIVEVHPQTGRPMTRCLTYHRSLWPRHLSPHASLGRRPKLMNMRPVWPPPEERAFAKLELIWQRPGIDGGLAPRRVPARMNVSGAEPENRTVHPIRVHHKALQTEEEPRKVVHDKATCVGSSSRSMISSRIAREKSQMLKEQQEMVSVAKKVQVEKLKGRDRCNGKGSSGSDGGHSIASMDAVAQTAAAADAVTPDPSLASSLTTDSQGIDELSTAAGLTAAFAWRHEVFQQLAWRSRSLSLP